MIDTVLTLLTVPTNGGFRLKNWAKSPLVCCFAGILVFVSRWSVSVCMVVGFGLYGGVIRLVWWCDSVCFAGWKLCYTGYRLFKVCSIHFFMYDLRRKSMKTEDIVRSFVF